MPGARDYLDRHDALRRRADAWSGHWQEVLDHVLPSRAPADGSPGAPGEKRGGQQFDSTATRFMRRLASTLMGLMASPAERWFALRAAGLEGVSEAEDWLDATVDTLYDALHDSNFYVEVPETLVDLICIGTGGLFIDERRIRRPGFNGFVFRNLAVGEYAIDEGPDGEVDTVSRKLRFTARQARLHFPGAGLHRSIVEALERGRGGGGAEEEFDFVHLVFRRDDPLLGEPRRPGDRSSGGSDWISVYLDAENEEIVSKGGFRDRRYFTPRWSKASGEVFGRGPAMDVLPDVKTLNTMVRYGLEGLTMSVYPPWLFPDESLVGNLRLLPGARNIYDPTVRGEIRALESRGNFAVEQAKEAELRQAIAQGFMDDVLGLREAGDVTATEVLDRRERRQQVTGPAGARIETELLDPVVTTAWMMLFRAGAFGPPPPVLSQARSIEVDFISPLARARKQGGARALQEAIAIVSPLAEGVPAMMDHYDFDRIARDVPADIGIPRKWLADEDAVAATRRRRAAESGTADA